jgi:uncharacterized protein (DUF1778 family)
MAHNSPRAMDIVSVRFSADQIDLISQEAEHNGVARSQFIRDAAYARAVMSAAQRNAASVRLCNALIAFVDEFGNDALSLQMRSALEAAEQTQAKANGS